MKLTEVLSIWAAAFSVFAGIACALEYAPSWLLLVAVGVLMVAALVFGLAACMLSSRISQDEERR